MSLSLLLLCLLWSLVEVHSQTPAAPYLTFNDSVIPNHAYVNLSLMMYPGNDDVSDTSSTVICHTDLDTCCRYTYPYYHHDRGDWYFPDGNLLPGAGLNNENQHHPIAQRRRNQLVRLQRGPPEATGDIPDGIYHCTIVTQERVFVGETVYVGVYGSGGDITIPNGMTMTVVSDLNGASPQFTLTCISTGGPATTVTWTKYCGDEMSVLNDAATAQYTHTLTVTGLPIGLYQCNVSNDKPSMASAQLEFQAQPESVTIHPVSATAVRISWRGNQYHSTTVRYLSYFNATGAEMSRYDTVLPPDVASTEVSLDDSVPGYQHTFTLQHIIACGNRTTPVTTATFDFDKEYFQIQFGPIDYCLNWGLEKTGHIEDQLQSHLTRIIRERCTDCSEFSEAYLRQGFFLCHSNPTTVTYRSILVNPSPTTHPNSTHMVGIIQTWVSTSPSLTVDRLLVRVNANCPTSTVSLDDAECVGGGSFLPDSAVTESITRVLSVCAVRQLGQDICTL